MFSAVLPTSDIAKILRHVRFVPKADLAKLCDPWNHATGLSEIGRPHRILPVIGSM
jgi:hypothetical protein